MSRDKVVISILAEQKVSDFLVPISPKLSKLRSITGRPWDDTPVSVYGNGTITRCFILKHGGRKAAIPHHS